jgi:hypothetical protein
MLNFIYRFFDKSFYKFDLMNNFFHFVETLIPISSEIIYRKLT